MNETKDDLKREKVRIVPISNIEDFPDHPLLFHFFRGFVRGLTS